MAWGKAVVEEMAAMRVEVGWVMVKMVVGVQAREAHQAGGMVVVVAAVETGRVASLVALGRRVAEEVAMVVAVVGTALRREH